MKTDKEKDVCNESRRQLLKQAYVAPVVIALGAMVLSSPANATNGGSSLSGGTSLYPSSIERE